MLTWLSLLLCHALAHSTPLQVHVICHTHDDIGWLKTVDQYATGQNNSIQHACTNCILDSVVSSLLNHPDRTFIYVEQGFFQRWWRVQTLTRQKEVKALVQRGQLQFVNGGWCMHDEATAHYIDMVDQTTYGHRYLLKEFGVVPRVGWQIDPFGHSATQAALLSAEVGFSSLFFGRIDYQDLAQRLDQKAPEFIWRASASLGASAQVFSGLTGSYGGNYGPPSGFCWDIECNDEPMQDDQRLKGYNVPSRLQDFLQQVWLQANQTQGNHIMLTMGSDFQYQSAEDWYRNLDKLIAAANADGQINMFYSTPEAYVAAKYQEQIAWPLKEDDFFPYADGPHQFWTGYFTSRPALKRYVRTTSAFLQIARQALAVVPFIPGTLAQVEALEEAMAVLQHHDAITGTAKQHVTFDYAARLAEGRLLADKAFAKALAVLCGTPSETITQCPLLNASNCPATQSGTGTSVVLWNALAQVRREMVELPVNTAAIAIQDGTGQPVAVQVLPSLPPVSNYGPIAGAPYTAVFVANVPALGFATYQLTPAASKVFASKRTTMGDADIILQNAFLRVKFCATTGLLCEITDLKTQQSVAVEQNYFWYNASTGDNASDQASGAYIFRPVTDTPIPVAPGKPQVELLQGPLVQEVRQTFSPWLMQSVRLASTSRHLEMTYTVGPIPVDDQWGKEIVSRFTTSIDNGGVCFTDSNGREMLRRQYNHRDTWLLNQTENVAGNYYPVTTAIFIADADLQLTLLTDSSQGGSGLVGTNGSGVLELMVHRRLLNDDSRGVVEPLNETEFVHPYTTAAGPGRFGEHTGRGLIIRGRHSLLLTQVDGAAQCWRPLQDRVYQPLHFAFTPRPPSISLKSLLSSALPSNVQVMTLQRLGPKQILLRLSHQFGLGEHPILSKSTTIDLCNLFAGLSIASIRETSLTANQLKATMPQWDWHTKTPGTRTFHSWRHASPFDWTQNTSVTLGPLEIKTFLLRLK